MTKKREQIRNKTGIKQEQIRNFSGTKREVQGDIIVLSKKLTTTPRKINCSVRILTRVPQLGLLNDRVESGNQADAMVADDHNPRREAAYGNSNIPSK